MANYITQYPREVSASSVRDNALLYGAGNNVLGPPLDDGSTRYWSSGTQGKSSLDIVYGRAVYCHHMVITSKRHCDGLVRVLAYNNSSRDPLELLWSKTNYNNNNNDNLHEDGDEMNGNNGDGGLKGWGSYTITLNASKHMYKMMTLEFDGGRYNNLAGAALHGTEEMDPMAQPLEHVLDHIHRRMNHLQFQLQILLHRKEEALAAIETHYAPLIQAVHEDIHNIQSLSSQVAAPLRAWRDRINRTPLHAYSSLDIKTSLHYHHIGYDSDMIDSNGIDGRRVVLCTPEDVVHKAIGTPLIGDCTRVIMLFHNLSLGITLTTHPKDIAHDGDHHFPETWSITQFKAWAASNALRDIHLTLEHHRFAGDIVSYLNIDVVATLLKLDLVQRAAFRREITDLRQTINDNMQNNDGGRLKTGSAADSQGKGLYVFFYYGPHITKLY